MFWAMSELDPALRDRLVRIGREGGLGGDLPDHFISRHRPGRLVVMFLVGLGLAGLGIVLTWTAWFEPSGPPLWVRIIITVCSVLAFGWMLVGLLKLVRAGTSPVKPFVLLTPKVLLVSDYAHGLLKGHRLSEATDFKKVETYDDKQNYAGLQFVFKFPRALIEFVEKDPSRIRRIEEALALARQGGALDPEASGESLLPAAEGSVKGASLRAFTRPAGEFWIVVLAFGFIGIIVVAILARILGK